MTTLKTDFSDGDIFYSGTTSDTDKLNGITNEINLKGEVHFKTYTSAGEDTDTSDSWADSDKTFTLTATSGDYITGIYISSELGKITNNYSTGAQACLKITGSNLGTKYIVSDDCYIYGETSAGLATASINIGASEKFLFYTNNTTDYKNYNISNFLPIKLLDETTTFMVRFKSDSDGVKIQNVNIVVMYVTPVIED